MIARPEQILWTARRMCPESLNDMRLLTWFESVESFAVERMALAGPKWALTIAGLPIAVGGLTVVRPGVVAAWVLSTPDLAHASYDALRLCRVLVRRALESPGIHRVEAHVRLKWLAAARFARHVGLRHEGTHAGYCADGSAAMTFALTKEQFHA